MTFLVVRDANGRNIEVPFNESDVKVSIFADGKTIEISIEPSDRHSISSLNPFVFLSLSRDVFSAALGEAAQRGRAQQELCEL